MQSQAGNSNAALDVQRIRLAFCLLAAGIFASALLLVPFATLLDPDNLWHVKIGLDLIETRTLPTVDTYSHTFAGQPWIAKEWLSQVVFALAYKLGGWNAVAVLTAAAIALTVFLLVWFLSGELQPRMAVGLTFVLALYLSQMYNARPYVLTFPIIVLWTAHLFRASSQERTPPIWLLAFLVLWANLHAAFTVGFVIAFFAFLDLLERVRLSKPDLLIKWVLFGLACPLVTLLNPYGIEAILATFTVAYGNEAIPHISEWQPFNADEMYAETAGLMAGLFLILISGVRMRLAKALLSVFIVYLYLKHIRFLYLLVLVVPLSAVVGSVGQESTRSFVYWAKSKRDKVETFLAGNVSRIAAGVGIVLVAGVAALFAVVRIEPSPQTYAKEALAFAKEHDLMSGNVINSYTMGGTLIFHGVKTYVDGRTDQLFLDGFMSRDAQTAEAGGMPLLKAVLDEYSITWALLATHDDRIPVFDEMPGWRQAYRDDNALIYVREGAMR